MAQRRIPKLLKIDNSHTIDWDSDPDFIFLVIHALLLALEEQGKLDPVQLRRAHDKLRLQNRERCRRHRTEI